MPPISLFLFVQYQRAGVPVNKHSSVLSRPFDETMNQNTRYQIEVKYVSLEIQRQLKTQRHPCESTRAQTIDGQTKCSGKNNYGRLGALVFQGWYRTTTQWLKLQRSVLTVGRSDVQAKTLSGLVCSEISLLACGRRLLTMFSNTSTYVCLLSSFKDTSPLIRAVNQCS